jgi:hypothetical protein
MDDRAELEAAWENDVTVRTEEFEQLRRDAQSVFRAMEGWQRVRTQEEWQRVVEAAVPDHRSGRFLLERLGAERHLDPRLMATLWTLRRDLLEEAGATTAAEAMLADLTILGYYHALRIQGWIGSLALRVEHELFGQESPTASFNREYGRANGLVVEEELKRLGEHLLPLLDRANRMTLRNLKAMQELRRRPAASVSIERAAQVNVAAQQVNTMVRVDGEGGSS